jgi:hypothetical protein
MKKSYLFPNFVLPLFGALAVMCAGSCSQEILEVSEDLAPDNLQTRAGIAQIGIVSNPAGKGIGNEYYGKDIDYTFNLVTSGVDAGIEVISTNVSVFTTIDGGIDQISRTDKSLKLRFTKCGVYQILATRNYRDLANPSGPIMLQQATITCRVASPVASIEGPSSVALGKVYNFSVNFEDPDYPDPNLEITEAIFNDPQCTIINNDGAGNYLIRFDQPGQYKIEPGLSWTSSSGFTRIKPCYCVNVFFRPEMKVQPVKLVSDHGIIIGRFIDLCDAQQVSYSSLPFRVYFNYKILSIDSFGLMAELSDWTEVYKAVGESGNVSSSTTTVHIDGLFYEGNTPSEPGDYWEISIPSDTCYYWNGSAVIAGSGEPIELLE